ncbi:hypothetical protein PR048_003995 [Dryococelus australis]|uniref:Uncharacterized protein n=1 Tax=Dryococelus australis TaxID=614101 RepID=A0ABQ9I483_9NEOP|nr:hypothetical protein PR048_003995 [Dryococelus australis]
MLNCCVVLLQSPSGPSVSDSDEEPVHKHPRLSGDISSDHLTDDGSYFEDDLEELSVMDTSPSSAPQTDEDAAMVGTRTEHTALLNGNCHSNSADVNDNYKSPTSSIPDQRDCRFDTSTRHRPNFGSFYFRHHDTDSEQDRSSGSLAKLLSSQKLCPVVSGLDESSDEEWTYTNGGKWKEQHAEEEEPPPRETIEKLVIQAEELVTTELTVTRVFEPLIFTADNKTKARRVRDWLRLHPEAPVQLQDSCDASGEYTTGDSDEEKGSDTSEDHNGSVSTCRQLSRSVAGSAEAFHDPDTTPVADKPLPMAHPSPDHPKLDWVQVVMRCRRQLGSGERPWSVSALSQLGMGMVSAEDAIANFSISESALHQLLGSTTPTAVTTLPPTEETASGSLRRRKVRTRRRTLGRKSDSGSGGGSGGSGGSDTQQKKMEAALASGKTLFGRSKSGKIHNSGYDGSQVTEEVVDTGFTGSFSGSPSTPRAAVATRSTSDPAVLGESTSGEDDTKEPSPMFKLGPGAGLVTVAPSVGLAEEQMSSFSEQAWDNYQVRETFNPLALCACRADFMLLSYL